MDLDVVKHSVTAGDYSDNPHGGAYFLNVAAWGGYNALPPSIDNLSFSEADKVTVSTIDKEAIWAGAIGIAITKVSSLAWEIEGDIPLRTKRGHELLMGYDAGRGWVPGISKTLGDFILTNNGYFTEIVRKTTSLNSQIIGLIPLDSLRCKRTGDPELPVIYTDLKGAQHELKNYEVIEGADMPSSRASLFGSGKCAAFRAYRSIYKLAVIEDYISEKVSGRNPSSLDLIRGLNDPQLQSVLKTASATADQRGVIAYMGAILATIPGDGAIEHVSIPLKGFPENFDRREELDIAVLSYANNLGLDVQDLQPLTGRALGTGAQSQVLDEKAKGKGLAAFRQQWTHAISTWVLPDMTTMVFVEKDWRDKNSEADYNFKTVNYVSTSVKDGVITAPQGLQILVDQNVYGKEFLPVDETPDTTLADDEKPEVGNPDQDEAGAAANPEPVEPADEMPVTPETVTKELRDALAENQAVITAIRDELNYE